MEIFRESSYPTCIASIALYTSKDQLPLNNYQQTQLTIFTVSQPVGIQLFLYGIFFLKLELDIGHRMIMWHIKESLSMEDDPCMTKLRTIHAGLS